MSKRRALLYVIALATCRPRPRFARPSARDRRAGDRNGVDVWLGRALGPSAECARAPNRCRYRARGETEPQGRVADLGTTIGSLDERLSSTQQYVARRVDAHDDKLVRLIRDLYGLRVLVQRTPSATAELDRVYRRLVHHDRPMPELGGWAMTSPTLVWAVDQISSGRVSTILECGSGSSTVWFALALEQRGGPGRIVSLESSPRTPMRSAPTLPSWD